MGEVERGGAAVVPTVVAPIGQGERMESLDVLRGFAVLGILAMNIMMFSGPMVGYTDPTAWPRPYEGGNRVAYWFTHVVFDLKMMSLFSMLFGAGVIVWDSKGRSAEDGRRVRWLWLRRMFWLFAIGMCHAWLLWEGDILVSYALCGVMVAWWVRRLRVGWLLALAGGFFAVHVALMFLTYLQAWMAFGDHGGGTPFGMPKSDFVEMREGIKRFAAPTAEMLQEDIAARQGSYWDVFQVRAAMTAWIQTFGFAFMLFWRSTAMMLLGMALVRTGVLTGHKSARFYAVMAGVCYGIGLPMVVGGILDNEAHMKDGRFDIVRQALVGAPLNAVGSLPVCLGHAAALLWLVRSGALGAVRRALSATGQMAFTNYLTQTMICTTLFYGYGFGLYGQLGRPALMGIVAAIWAVQVVWSVLWLRRFRFGPAEWLWRSLTYWKVQGMVRRSG